MEPMATVWEGDVFFLHSTQANRAFLHLGLLFLLWLLLSLRLLRFFLVLVALLPLGLRPL